MMIARRRSAFATRRQGARPLPRRLPAGWTSSRRYRRARLWSGAEKPGNLKPLVRPSPSRWDTPESERVARALQRWGEAEDPRGTLAERYLASRELALDDDLAGRVLRFHRQLSFREGRGGCSRSPPVPARALPRYPQRRAARDPSRRPERRRPRRSAARCSGRSAAAVIKLDADEDVTHGLHLAEGLETALAAMQRHDWRPMWCTGSADALKRLSAARRHRVPDPRRRSRLAGLAAAQACAERWAKAETGSLHPLADRPRPDFAD